MKFLKFFCSISLVVPTLCAAIEKCEVCKIVVHTPAFEHARIQQNVLQVSCTVASQACLKTKQAFDGLKLFSHEIVGMMLAYLPVVKKLIMQRDDDIEHPLEVLYWEHIGGPTLLQVRTMLEREAPFAINIHYQHNNRRLVDGPPYPRNGYVLQASKNCRIAAIQDCRRTLIRDYRQTASEEGCRQHVAASTVSKSGPQHTYML